MNILYYGEPDIARGGGVGKVAYYLPEALTKKIGVTHFGGIKLTKSFPEIYFKIFNQFTKKEYNIIHFNAGPSWKNGGSVLLRFARLRKIGTVLNIHGIPQLERIAEQSSQSYSFIDWMSVLGYSKLADRVVVNSEYMRNNVVKWYRVNCDKVVVIPNGVDLKIFAKNSDTLFLDGDPSLLFVGHFGRLKGVDILIRSLARLKSELPKIKLHLIGRGNIPYFAALAKQEEIEDHVFFHGWANQSMVARYYRSADICVFPSRHEGFGIVILEAMASGVPIIASNIPSFSEIISDGIDGKLFKSEDPEALSKEVITLCRDPHLKKELSHNALKKAMRYSWDNIADKYIALYESLCDEL